MYPLRQIARYSSRILPACRPMSSAPLVDVTDSDGIAVVTLQRLPVNSLNLELLQALKKALDDVENNKPRGMILTSVSIYEIRCHYSIVTGILKKRSNKLVRSEKEFFHP